MYVSEKDRTRHRIGTENNHGSDNYGPITQIIIVGFALIQNDRLLRLHQNCVVLAEANIGIN